MFINRKLFFKFELHNRIYEGNYDFNDFMHYCYIVLHNQYPFLPKELLLSRAKFIWNKKLKEADISNYFSKEPTLSNAKINKHSNKKDKIKLNRLSIESYKPVESPIYSIDSPASTSTIHLLDNSSENTIITSSGKLDQNMSKSSIVSDLFSDANRQKDNFPTKNVKCSISESLVPLNNNYTNGDHFFTKEKKKLTTTIEPSSVNIEYFDLDKKVSISDNIIRLDHNDDY